ncbi:hypothetical protein PF004_g21891 [Phytophthora fragariae]|uniref:Uncharacterized protein n=1 Tax=Phytophthora fragariae TaxID=53985 RepID=A0A6G0N2H3_9STRA|nr:hypothetical protein PF004_g21891 [Phytophthora fragariae]
MRTQSEWMMMFAPVAMAQAKWPVLGPELTQPVNSTSINQLIEDTVLLLRAMGFRCNSRPNSLILGGWTLSRAGTEITRWKRRLRSEFCGVEIRPKRDLGRVALLAHSVGFADRNEVAVVTSCHSHLPR